VMRLRRVRVLTALDRKADALRLLDNDSGFDSYTGWSSRIRAERDAVRAQLTGAAPAPVATALLGETDKLPPGVFAAAVRRGWLTPTLADLQQLADRPKWRDAALQLAPFVLRGSDGGVALGQWISATPPPDAASLAPWTALSRALFFELVRKA